MAYSARVLIVDDEPNARAVLEMRLADEGFEVTLAPSGHDGLRLAYECHPDAIILDVMMPGMDGLEVCRRLRELTDAVILFVSVKGNTEDIVAGLHAGADDYVLKPYRYKELLARLEACLRRRENSKASGIRLASGEAVLSTDPERRLVFVEDGRSVQLTPREFEVLEFMAKNSGRVLSQDAILANVWGPEYIGERELVKQFIYRLRSKLEPNPSDPEHIVTVRGSGYVLEEDTRPAPFRRGAGASAEDGNRSAA